jgi:hypothetical protein
MHTGLSTASLGCIGNRVYTNLADDELYFALPGAQIGLVVEKLAAIIRANHELENFHRARLATSTLGQRPVSDPNTKEVAIHVS